MKNNFNIAVSYAREIQDDSKFDLTIQCCEVAKDAHFPTDFDDVYDHLFCDDNSLLTFVRDDSNQVIAFMIGAIASEDTLHVHGVIIGEENQGKGLCNKLIKANIKKLITEESFAPTYLCARTQNPAIYQAFKKISEPLEGNHIIFPNRNFSIPDDIRDMAKENPFVGTIDDKLIQSNAYPDSKVMADVHDETTKAIFNNLNPTDGQIVVSMISNNLIAELETEVLMDIEENITEITYEEEIA